MSGAHPGPYPSVRLKRLDPRAIEPAYQTELAAGLDLCACLPEGRAMTLAPMARDRVPTGWAVAIPAGYEGQVRPRSGLATRLGLTLPNPPGTIDADYRGELSVAVVNIGAEPVEITHGMRVAQLVIAPVAHARLELVDELDRTARDTGGFGSTGVS